MRRLRVQLAVLLALLGLLLAAWGATMFLGTRAALRADPGPEVSRAFNELRRHSGELGARFVDVETAERDYLLTGDPRRREDYLAARREAEATLERVHTLARPWPGLLPIIDSIGDHYEDWQEVVATEVSARPAVPGQPPSAAVLRLSVRSGDRYEALRERHASLLGTLVDLQTRTMQRQRDTYLATQRLALQAAVMILAAVVLLAFYLRRAVGAPAAALRTASGRLAGGDLDTPVRLAVDNELGSVATDLETMRRRLSGRIGALQHLRELSAQVVGATSLPALCGVALEGLRPEVGATRAALVVARPTGTLRLRALSGVPETTGEPCLGDLDPAASAALPLAALRRGQVVGMTDLDQVQLPLALGRLLQRCEVSSAALVPLISRGSLLGLLALLWTEPHRLDHEEEALLGLAGNHIAGALATALRLEEIERAAGQARAVFYAIADGVVLTDPQGRVTAMNRALEGLCGWSEDDARGRLYHEVLPMVDDRGAPVEPCSRPLASTLASGKPAADRGFSVALVTRRGHRVPVASRSAPVLDRYGRVVGGVDVIRDVSREREIDEVKNALVSTVSHELRTPLTLIHGFAELLVVRDMPRERRRSAAEEILEASKRLARLIDDLLSVSRLESGRLVLDPRPLDFLGMVERVLSPFRAMASDHKLLTEVPGDLPVVWGDQDKVEQILTNLVGNAIKYSPGGGEVLVAVHDLGAWVQVDVADEGIGMTPGEMSQLFEKFYRVDRDEVRRAGGTGLGLYITKRLVEMHGGRIWTDSAPGSGSVFTFVLPCHTDRAGRGDR